MQRAQKLRMTGLATVAALAVAVPLGAAMAGPARTPVPHTAAPGTAYGVPEGARGTSENRRSTGRAGTLPGGATAGSRPAGAARARHFPGPPAGSGLPSPSGRTTRCGPELGSARGVEAQTCVLAERGRTWARTYYRNITGTPLRAVLTLLRPNGTTVQVNCEVAAADVPGVCETPTGRTARGGRAAYGAVAEIADAAGERLLLRSGSNSAPGASGSDR
ncbi:hypothetical protein [Streptomyces lydicus]|uniref:hypothetical protein n=2 Tax=Streptomyces lydicus TaxID=47763 RepID=UPI0006902533|nr:hypothetical protein [Streptomyces lydicus]